MLSWVKARQRLFPRNKRTAGFGGRSLRAAKLCGHTNPLPQPGQIRHRRVTDLGRRGTPPGAAARFIGLGDAHVAKRSYAATQASPLAILQRAWPSNDGYGARKRTYILSNQSRKHSSSVLNSAEVW